MDQIRYPSEKELFPQLFSEENGNKFAASYEKYVKNEIVFRVNMKIEEKGGSIRDYELK